MNIYCIEDFKAQFEKLISKKSYSTIEQEIIEYFFDKSNQELCSGTRLNNSDITPYIKKRLGGSGGFRIYFLILLKNEDLYLMFVHPKTGSLGADNLTTESIALLYKRVLNSITNKDAYSVKHSEDKKSLTFTKLIPQATLKQ